MGPERCPPAPLPTTEGQAGLLETVEGSECSIQTLYEGNPKCQCCKNWVIDYPEDLRVAVEEQLEAKQKALVVRMGKNHGSDGGKPLVLHSVVVQSSALKQTLSEVFDGFKGITPSLKKLVFRAPFKPFHHRWNRFTQILERQKQEDPGAAAYTQLLYDVLDAEIRDVRTEVADLLDNGVITYPLLWALFEPGVTVFTESRQQPCFSVVESRGYDRQNFTVTAKFVDWDGDHFGYATKHVRINAFGGTRAITDLPSFPASFHPSCAEVKANAIARGRKFRELAGVHYRAYSGIISYIGAQTKNIMERYTSGRIVVDTTGYVQAEPLEDDQGGRAYIFVTPLDPEGTAPRLRVTDDVHSQQTLSWMSNTNKPRSRCYETGPQPSPRQLLPDAGADAVLTPDQLLLCSPTVRAYSLKLKLWGLFSVSDITPISFNDTAFPNLMLPPTYKELILSFVEAHPITSAQEPENNDSTSSSFSSSPEMKFDDLIEGKGLGVILLLVGNPGTGKTLTAEAVADRVRRPLYVLSAGELGQSAHDVEVRLRDALELAERWDAVLLFDECDIFLQERSSGSAGGTWDLARNEIVAVFLRMLEYYRGILFMTTNRADTLDKAFHSRIHLTLRYPDLDDAAKEHIWRHFSTVSGGGSGFPAASYERLAKLPMNGRQIKNTVKIATLLATRQKAPLGLEHVRTALQATQGVQGSEVAL